MLTPPNSPQKKAEGGGKRGEKEKKKRGLCVFEIFLAQRIEHVKRLKM
jgi:hypothetical protein